MIDVDECTLGISRCHQVCRNTIGSYQCDCDSGYQLHADSFTCEGTYLQLYCICALYTSIIVYIFHYAVYCRY